MPYDFNYNQTPAMIIYSCQLPYYELYDLKRFGDLYRNRDLIQLFDGADVLTVDEITPRFAAMKDTEGHSQAFEARRAGEVIKWAVDRGLAVECIHDKRTAWRILDREMNFMAIGPAKKQRVIRIRGLKDPVERAEANKLFNRECRRRDKARAKETTKQRDAIAKHLDVIMRLAPELALPDDLERFRVTGQDTTFAQARFLLIDAAADDDKWTVLKCVAAVAIDLLAEESKRVWTIRNSTPVSLSEDDADAMGSLGF